jgi:hypothetical protein
MPKSKTDKKRKKRVVAFKAKIQSDRKKFRDTFLKGMQETQSREMEEQVNSAQGETDVEGLGEFSMDNNGSQKIVDELAGLGLEVEQVELSEAPPDSFAGKVK